MKKFTLTYSQNLLPKCKFCFFVLILIVCDLPLSAQNFTDITWTKAAPQKYGISEQQGKVVNGKLYVFGGFDITKSTYTPTKRAYVYNPVTNVWSAIADLPYTPNGPGFGGITHAGIATDGTDIFLAGGYTSNTAGTGQIFGSKQVWKYVVSQNVYVRLPDLPISIAAGQMEFVNGKLHYVGGINAARTVDLGNHYVLDLSNLQAGWITRAPLPNPRQHGGSAVINGKMYFIGGQHGNDATSVAQKDVHAYNEATNSWTKMADLPVPSNTPGRAHIFSSVVVMGDRIIVLGGETSWKIVTNMVSAYSPATNSWKNLTPLPVPRSSGVAGVMIGNLFYSGGNRSITTYKGWPVVSQDTLLPVGDAFVRNGDYAGTNYGADTTLVVKGSSVNNYTRFSYLKFSVASASNITSAKLHIYGRNIDNTTGVRISAYGVDNDNWSETGINFNNAPAALTAPFSSVSIGNQLAYYELDVTDYVKTQFAGDKIVSLLIKDAAAQNSNLWFNSRESSKYRPKLIINSSSSRPDNNTIQVTTTGEDLLGFDKEVVKPLLYPNPVRSSFNVAFPANYEGDFNIEIADQSGRVYNLGKVTLERGGTDMTFYISKFSLSAGVYFLKIKSKTLSNEIKLIKQ